jgi:hypothetical protein
MVTFMAAKIEDELTAEQKAGVVIKASDKKYVVAWRFTKNLKPFVGISDVRWVTDEWLDTGGNAWPADAVAGMASAILEIAADRPSPALVAPRDVELRTREKAPEDKTWVIAIDKKSVLVVYPTNYDGTPSVMVRNYKQKSGWNFTCYDIIDMTSAVKVAEYVLSTR